MRTKVTVDVEGLEFNRQGGLVPAIIVHDLTNDVLMLGYMSREALLKTIETEKVTFFSRSRQKLWTKGETSGNFLNLVSIDADCDRDTLLVRVRPEGPVCHRNTASCFPGRGSRDGGFVLELQRIIDDRTSEGAMESYTHSLVEAGTSLIAQKIGEEAVEVVVAALSENSDSLLDEAADLVYHLLVLLRSKELRFEDVENVLQRRHEIVSS